MTLKTVHKALKDYGYRYESSYAYKAFPIDDEYFQMIYSNEVGGGGPVEGTFVESVGYYSNMRR